MCWGGSGDGSSGRRCVTGSKSDSRQLAVWRTGPIAEKQATGCTDLHNTYSAPADGSGTRGSGGGFSSANRAARSSPHRLRRDGGDRLAVPRADPRSRLRDSDGRGRWRDRGVDRRQRPARASLAAQPPRECRVRGPASLPGRSRTDTRLRNQFRSVGRGRTADQDVGKHAEGPHVRHLAVVAFAAQDLWRGKVERALQGQLNQTDGDAPRMCRSDGRQSVL